MNLKPLYHSGFAALFAIAYATVCAADDQAALRATVEKTRELHNIKKASLPAFVLQGTITFWPKENTPIEGLYRVATISDGQWKEEVAFKGFSRTRIGDGKQFMELDAPNVAAPHLYTLDVLLDLRKMLYLREEDSLKGTKPPKQIEQSASCIKRTRKAGTEDTFCFDSRSGDLLSRTSSSSGAINPWYPDFVEFSDFQSLSGKSYPRTLRAFGGKKRLAEVKFEEVKLSPMLPKDFFVPPAGATAWVTAKTRHRGNYRIEFNRTIHQVQEPVASRAQFRCMP